MNNSFDIILAVSSIEHVYPENGGDIQALNEISRILDKEGTLFVTLPFKNKASNIYLEGEVYGRNNNWKNFFAREYDDVTLRNLLKNTNYVAKEISYICEKPGFFSLDYYKYGEGKGTLKSKFFYKLKGYLEKTFNKSIDSKLAKHALFCSKNPEERLVNIALSLKHTQ